MATLSDQISTIFSCFPVAGKSPVPVHCVVEAIHSIVESRLSVAREKWRNPHVEIDTYVIIPAAVPFQVRYQNQQTSRKPNRLVVPLGIIEIHRFVCFSGFGRRGPGASWISNGSHTQR